MGSESHIHEKGLVASSASSHCMASSTTFGRHSPQSLPKVPIAMKIADSNTRGERCEVPNE